MDHNTELLLDIVWPEKKDASSAQLNADFLSRIYQKITSPDTQLLDRNIDQSSGTCSNSLIANELRRMLLVGEWSKKLDSKVNSALSSNTKNFLPPKKDPETSLPAKPTRKMGTKKFTKMNILEEFKPVILTGDAKPKTPPEKKNTIETFQLIDLSEDSRNLAQRK